jgi:hypothetical protein
VPRPERHPVHALQHGRKQVRPHPRTPRHQSGAHAHSLWHQFASEAPRELANISQVLGHDSVETTLRFYIHASANAEQRIGALMNARWTSRRAARRIPGHPYQAIRLALPRETAAHR